MNEVKMKKAALTMAAILAGCSLQNAPEARHVQPVQAVSAQPAAFSHNPDYNAPLCNNLPEVRIDRIFYTIECSDYQFSHTEGLSGCNERLLYETEGDRKRFADYGCDGTIDLYWHFELRNNGRYEYYALVEQSKPATEEQTAEYNKKLDEIGQPDVDARWRFIYHIQPRGGN
ncbi:MAG: hypothetical protein PHO02_05635 [Candidatus Nanoarchaeia archaeon]|nr:hypothetical protein [Candidatus Nanoarchaeia archaeon]